MRWLKEFFYGTPIFERRVAFEKVDVIYKVKLENDLDLVYTATYDNDGMLDSLDLPQVMKIHEYLIRHDYCDLRQKFMMNCLREYQKDLKHLWKYFKKGRIKIADGEIVSAKPKSVFLYKVDIKYRFINTYKEYKDYKKLER